MEEEALEAIQQKRVWGLVGKKKKTVTRRLPLDGAHKRENNL